MQSLVSQCHTLRHISLMGSSRVSDRAFKHLATENRKLRSIKVESKSKPTSLTSHSTTTDSSPRSPLPLSLPFLDNLVITDSTLRALGKACRDLQQVYFAGCSRITDQGMKALGSLKKLQVLNIADCSRYINPLRYISYGNSWFYWRGATPVSPGSRIWG